MYNKIKNWNRIKQKSIQWFDERNKIITATDVSSILEINPFVSKYEVLQNKLQTILKRIIQFCYFLQSFRIR